MPPVATRPTGLPSRASFGRTSNVAAEEAMREHLLELRVLYRRAARWRSPER